MSQSLQKQIPLTERGHRVFDMVRKFARGAEEIEISLISTTGEYLRFGNNELGQSQSTKNRTLSVRLSSGKKQARTTTGRLEESFIQKAVEKAVSQLKTAPEDPDYLPMLGQQSYQTVSRYHTRTVEESTAQGGLCRKSDRAGPGQQASRLRCPGNQRRRGTDPEYGWPRVTL